MKKLCSILSVSLAMSLGAQAQFARGSVSKPAPLINLKYTSREQTLKIAAAVGEMSEAQTEKLYTVNLELIRKYFFHQDDAFNFDENSLTYQKFRKEAEERYKAVLSQQQYSRYLDNEKRSEIGLAGHNSNTFDSQDSSRLLEKRISSTK
jgi:hypothetical protein